MRKENNKYVFEAGLRFHRLTTVRTVWHLKKTLWECLCDCGETTIVAPAALNAGASYSCGCMRPELTRKRHTTHGKSKSREFNSWRGMVDRCTNKNNTSYPHYGGRGIEVCDRWRSFSNFYTDMGDRPDGMSLDRINVDGNYEPRNCRWATKQVQATNQRTNVLITKDGVTKPVSVWAKELSIKPITIYERLRRGWSQERALSSV